MAKIKKQVICLALYAISIISGENLEESSQNQIEDGHADPKDISRNTRFIRYQGVPGSNYYHNTGGGGGGGYFYPNPNYDGYPVVNQFPEGSTQFYPSNRYPNKLDPNYWLSKLPGLGGYNPNTNPGYYPPNYPSNYPGSYPGSGTNFVGYNPNPGRYPSSGYYPQSGYPQSGYPQSGYPHSSYPHSSYPQSGYPQSGYPTHGYTGSGYPSGNGGYGGYQGNGGLTSYSGYDGYYDQGNKPGNIGYGYHNSRTHGIVGPAGRYPNTLLPIATPATVSKDAK